MTRAMRRSFATPRISGARSGLENQSHLNYCTQKKLAPIATARWCIDRDHGQPHRREATVVLRFRPSASRRHRFEPNAQPKLSLVGTSQRRCRSWLEPATASSSATKDAGRDAAAAGGSSASFAVPARVWMLERTYSARVCGARRLSERQTGGACRSKEHTRLRAPSAASAGMSVTLDPVGACCTCTCICICICICLASPRSCLF